MSIRGGSLSGPAPLEDDGQLKLHDASVDLASLTIGAGGELSGSGTVADPITNLGTIDASKRKLDLQGAVTGDGQLHIDNKATLELGGPTGEAATFEGNRGTLFLDKANDFSGTVAGMAKRDAIDLADFAFSSHPSITSVVGTGAAGSTTDVTITDASLTTTIHLLNQYANQFAVAPSAYALTSDHSGSASAGTWPVPIIARSAARRFLPPWTIEEANDARVIVKDQAPRISDCGSPIPKIERRPDERNQHKIN